MLKVLACDEGGSVTCAILRVVDKLGQDPDGFQWWASIVIPAVAAIASVAVLAFSVWTANSARKQAKASEAARIAEASHRIEDDRKRRFVSRIAELLEVLPKVLDDIHEKVGSATVPLIVRISAAALEANPAEQMLLRSFRRLALLSEKDAKLQAVILGAGSDVLIEWMHASRCDRKKLHRMMDELGDVETTKEANRLVQNAWSLNDVDADSDAETIEAEDDVTSSSGRIQRSRRWVMRRLQGLRHRSKSDPVQQEK